MLKPIHVDTPPCKWKNHRWIDATYVVLEPPGAAGNGRVAILQECPNCRRIRFLPMIDDGVIEGYD